MPLYSDKRGVELITTSEAATLFGTSDKTIKRALSKPSVYVEYHFVTRDGTRGAAKTAFVDPSTLATVLKRDVPPKKFRGTVRRDIQSSEGQERLMASPTQDIVLFDEHEKSSEGHSQMSLRTHSLDLINSASAHTKLAKLEPILRYGKRSKERSEAVRALAEAESMTSRAIYRWLSAFEKDGLKGLAKVARSDKGRHRISPVAYGLIRSGIFNNPVTTPPAQVYRMLLRAVPDVMMREYGGKRKPISLQKVVDIKRKMLSNPHDRLLLYNEDARKEHLRVWVGEVFSAHANDLWQMDMTRCDIKVCVPGTGVIDRPRIHAIIDVYSGCIPGWAFSFEEDQTQTDLALSRAFRPRADARWQEKWPVYGIPKRMYWDNGKTYRSKQAERIMTSLGVEVINSKPRVSHTRGKIERFFRSLHDFERTLPGYTGSDPKSKPTEELKRLEASTKRWLEGGRDPGRGERLLTMEEYQIDVLGWLIGDYQNPPEVDRTRLDHYLESVVETNTQHLINPEDLFLLIAKREKRMVEGNGQVRFENRRWAIPDGSLTNYQRLPVWVLQDQFAVGDDRLWIAYEELSGKLTPLGIATPVPTRADSIEAGDLRRNSVAQARAALQAAKETKKDYTDPNFRVATVLNKQLAVERETIIQPVPLPQSRARFSALDPEAKNRARIEEDNRLWKEDGLILDASELPDH